MSYAAVAASGPEQSAEEKMPPPVPEVAHDDSNVHSLDSLGNISDDRVHAIGGENKQPSYADQQLAEEKAEQARQSAKKEADKVSEEAKDFMARAEKDAQRLTEEAKGKAAQLDKDAGKKFEQFKDDASKEYSKVKKELGIEADKAKKGAKNAEQWADKNKKNPVVVGNAVVITALAGLLGIGAYRMQQANTLTWKVAGAWAGAVGLFAVGDYFVSQYFFRKYPTK